MTTDASSGATAGAPLRWRYRAADAQGRERTGTLLAPSAAAAHAQLRQQALWLIALDPEDRGVGTAAGPDAGERSAGAYAVPTGAPGAGRPLAGRAAGTWWSPAARWWRRATGAEAELLAVHLRALSALLAAGVPLDRALGAVADDAPGGPGAGRATAPLMGDWGRVFRTLQDRVRNGAAFSGAVAALADDAGLPVALAPSLAAAEESGTLADVVARAATALEAEAHTRAAIRASLTYPALLAVAATVATSVILLVVVPRFALLLDDAGVSLPWSTALLLSLGRALERWGWTMPLLLVAAGWWWRDRQRDATWRARQDARRLRWPVVGPLIRQRDGARYAGTLAMALDAGVPLLRAMSLARGAVSNRALAAACQAAEAAVRDGHPLAGALADVLPPLTLRLLEAGERAGALAAMASRAAAAADEAVTRAVARAVTFIEPALILTFGGVVGFVALALLQAIYGLNAASF